jgi:hypothetical protein
MGVGMRVFMITDLLMRMGVTGICQSDLLRYAKYSHINLVGCFQVA